MGQKKNVDMSMTDTKVKVVEVEETPADETKVVDQEVVNKPQKTTQKKQRSLKYQAVRAQVDKTRQYDPFSAIELVKKLSYSKFTGTVTAHLELLEKFQGERAELTFPHSTGKSLQVEIASDKTFAKIEAGTIDFDILLATPDLMPKLAKHAKILGPRGLMPNPKQGTLTAKPAEKKKELEAGQISIKTERKAPLMHVVIGNTSMETKELQENLQALINTLKGKIKAISLAATMSPGVKVALEK
jgi:large subunit ribosomal protein L1